MGFTCRQQAVGLLRRIQQHLPMPPSRHAGQGEGDNLMMGIQQQ
jgi:hypothetical protein